MFQDENGADLPLPEDFSGTLACAVELEPFGAFPRFVRTVYHLAIDEGAMEGEDLLFDAGYIGEL